MGRTSFLVCYNKLKSNDTFTNGVVLRIFDHALIIPIRCGLFLNQEIGVCANGSKPAGDAMRELVLNFVLLRHAWRACRREVMIWLA